MARVGISLHCGKSPPPSTRYSWLVAQREQRSRLTSAPGSSRPSSSAHPHPFRSIGQPTAARSTLSRVTHWWEVVAIGAVVVLVSVLIGILVGVRAGRREAGVWPQHATSASYLERRAVAYLEVAIGWHAYLESVRPLAYPGEGFVPERPRDLAAVIRSRAQLEQFGTSSAQQFHDDALEAAVALIN